MATLEEIRAKLLANQKKADGERTGGDNAVFAFWNAPEGSTSTLRFLPDGNPANTFFWQERLMIRLPFQGIKGEHDREVIVNVPCMEMYGESCPILTETRPWWKEDQTMQDLARKYWKKKSYIFQGFVVQSGFEEKETPSNLIRRFVINPSIFNKIKASLMDPEMEDLPTDYINGVDFRLVKASKGGYANYDNSTWARKSRPLSDVEQAAIEEHGLYNLADFLPKKPGPEEVEIIKEMFAASVDNQAYDGSRWGNYFKASGSFGRSDDTALPAATPVKVTLPTKAAAAPAPAPVVEAEDEAPKASTSAAPAAAGGKPDASEILRRIKERQASGGK